MAAVSGARTTLNINQDQRVVDMADKIALLQPSANPLTLLTKKIGAAPAHNAVFNWLEDDLQGRWSAINLLAGYADDAVEMVVDDGTLFTTGDIVKVPRTGEVMRVTSVATNTLTVVRGYGTTTAAAIVDDDPLVILGNAYKEGDDVGTAKSVITSTVYNYTQIFRTPVKVTNTQNAIQLYGGNDLAYQRRKKGIEHAIDIERAAWFGEKSEHTTDGIIRTTGGILSYIAATAPTYDPNGSLTEANFETEFCEDLFQYGSDKKTLFASSRLISIINSWGKSKLQLVTSDETYGLAVTRYLSAHGVLNIVQHPLFEGAVYGLYGVALDLENIRWRPLAGRDTKLRTNIGPASADYILDEYLTEGGFEVKLPKTHGIIKRVGFPA